MAKKKYQLLNLAGADGNLLQDGVELAHIIRWALRLERTLRSGAHSDSDHWEEVTSGSWVLKSGSVTVEADEDAVPAALEAAIIAGNPVEFAGLVYTGNNYTGKIILGNATEVGADAKGNAVEGITFQIKSLNQLKVS